MYKIKHCVAIAIAFLACGIAQAGDVEIIANPSVAISSISPSELKSVFLGTKTTLSDGSRVEPVLGQGGAAHEMFLKEYLGKTSATLQTYYRSLVFTGKGSMPKTLATDAEVVAYVARTKGAIAYVSGGASVTGVKTLAVK